MRFKNFTLLLGAFFMLAASSQAANVALGKKYMLLQTSSLQNWRLTTILALVGSRKLLTATISGSTWILRKEPSSTT